MLFLAEQTFCRDTANIWLILGYIVNVIKIVIPLILIILGMLDLGKAVVASDDKAINKAVTSLVKRFIAAVVMFFVPSIISAIFGLINVGDLKGNDANICVQCVTNMNKEITFTVIEKDAAGKDVEVTKSLTCEKIAETYSVGIK